MAKTLYDSISRFINGVDSGRSPLDLDKETLAFGLNTTVRGGYVHPRPPFMKQFFNFGGDAELQEAVERGFFQGATKRPYNPDFGPSSHVAQISGRLFKFTPSATGVARTWDVTEITIPGDPNDATTGQVWMWQAEKWLIITDGTSKLPIFYDGTTSRRSYGPSVLLGTLADPFTPPNPRVIGEIITVTLTAPYTGQFDVPVLFNGEYYQAKQNSTPGYSVRLTNVSDVPGNVQPIGSSIVVQPAYIGKLARTTNFGSVFFPAGTSTFPGIDTFNLPSAVPVIPIGTRISLQNSLITTQNPGLTPFQFDIIAIQNPSAAYPGTVGYGIRTITNFYGPLRFDAGTLVQYATSPGPATVLGTLTEAMTAPAVGSYIDVGMSQPYLGAPNQSVWINGSQYLISETPPVIPGTTLSLINLTDTDTAVIEAGSDILSIPELPAGRMGAYGMSHVAMCLVDGISFIYGDTLGGPSGTPANNYRDSVLKTTENDFLVKQGAFRIPSAGEIITSMTFVAILDTALGQGPLELGTPTQMISCAVPSDRDVWALLTSPILTVSLIGKGPLAQNSTGLANSDTLFRQYDGIGSLILARRNFSDSWGNAPISREMERILKLDNQSLLSYGSEANFDNRRLDTCSPQVSNQGVFHVGQTAINFDPISNLRGKLPSVWDGVLTGINILQWNVGVFDNLERCFPFTFNFTEQKIEMYELLREGTDEYLDNGETPILWAFETPVLFHPDQRPEEMPLVKLMNGKIHLQKMKGDIHIKVMFRPLFFPCWVTWHEQDICVTSEGDLIKPGFMTIGLGNPPVEPCDDSSGIPLIIGRGFQLRCEITGQAEFMSGDFEAAPETTVTFPPPQCEPTECRTIACYLPDDLRLFSLQGLQPLPLPTIDQNIVGNDAVYYDFPCEGPS